MNLQDWFNNASQGDQCAVVKAEDNGEVDIILTLMLVNSGEKRLVDIENCNIWGLTALHCYEVE